ncbi:MFS transporter [Azotosporobacter soli]|uniref:MFS transporter n=1 Tax=Azotosporobacter soli TaxID=3055040 RepID=UPI0031FE4E40
MSQLVQQLRTMDRNYFYFLLSTAFIGIAQSVDGATLTNYLRDNLGMMILERSALEFPRELPGLLIVFIIGALSSLGDIKTTVIANILAAGGMFALGIIPPDYTLVVIFIFIYNMGTHIYMPMSNSIGMSFASAADLGKKLGRMNAVNTAALVSSSAILWALFRFFHISFTAAFSIGAVAYLCAAFCLSKVHSATASKKNSRLVLRKEYALYYWLCVLFGARKQIFITFGPWVLVDIFHQPVTTMTILFFIISLTGIVVKPWIGRMIDTLGERRVLCGEAVAFLFVCLGYAFATDLLPQAQALLLICACYILDQSMSSVSMARATYMRKLALTPADISPSLSMGTSIDHIVTMFLPILGGIVWYNGGPNGYKLVFLGGALIALLNFFSARFINLTAHKSNN